MLILWLTAALAGEALTLEQALSRAVADNLELSSQRRENRIAELELNEARAGFDPQLSGSARTGGSRTPTNNAIDGAAVVTSSDSSWSAGLSSALPTGGSAAVDLGAYTFESDSANAVADAFTTTSAGLSVSQPLLRGAFQGSMASLRDAKLSLLEQEILWRQQLEQITLRVSDAYWGLVSAREGRVLAERAVDLAQQQLSETQERQQAGFAGSGDVLQVQVSLGQTRRSLVDATANQEAAEATLARVLGMPVEAGADLEPVDRPSLTAELPSRSALLERAQASNSDYLLAEIAKEWAVRGARRSRNAALPDLTVDGSAGWSAGAANPADARAALVEAPSPSWGVGVSVGLPLVQRDAFAQHGMAKLRQEQAEIALEAAGQDLVLAVDAGLRDVTRDRASLEVARQTREHAELSLQAQRELLGEGRGSTRDVVDSLESLRAAELAELAAEIALQGSLQRVLQVSGQLVEPLD